MSVSLVVAFLAGLATFFSPCILPIIPGYIAILSGGKKDLVVRRMLLFSLGLGLVFSLIGAVIGLIGAEIIGVRDILIRIVGVVLVIYGIFLIKPFPLLGREFRLLVPTTDLSDLGAFSLGGAFGIAWTPCTGVILGLILTQALYLQIIPAAASLLLFSLGMILPMLGLAFIYQKTTTFIRLPNLFTRYYNLIIGVVVIILGVMLVTGLMDWLRIMLLSFAPNLEQGLLSLPR